jgi:hypothetical protein
MVQLLAWRVQGLWWQAAGVVGAAISAKKLMQTAWQLNADLHLPVVRWATEDLQARSCRRHTSVSAIIDGECE